jgi:hypothetical protein
MSAASECDAVLRADATASLDTILKAINRTASDNFTILTLSGLMLALTAAVLWFVGARIVSLVVDWRSVKQRQGSATRAGGKAQGTSSEELHDDVQYALPAPAAPDAEGRRADATSVAKRIADLKALYAPYNAAMVKYAQRRGRVADDLIDERIIGRADDNYNYRRRRRDDLRFRREDGDGGGGEWVVVPKR